ncbi:hypothetical protein ACFQJ7_10450 [Halovenus rubra]|uniref:Uncharacterized protein n=2 Tax=Halovenus rubra TaxID=869890 RepID=A0ABD5X5H8_9EURY|nr:hypothetical protein [Halovenus rubra]
MSRWQRRVDDLLYDGETVRKNIDIRAARVVVTSHRVLTFTPQLDGENFQQADRPNVTSVTTSALAPANVLRRGLLIGVIGAVLVVAGVLFDPESIFGDSLELDTTASSDFGLGGFMDATRSMFSLLMNLDTLLLNIGALGLLLATVLLGVYWYLRTPTLVLEQAGDNDDVHLPRPEAASDVAYQLEEAILPDPREDTESGTDTPSKTGHSSASSDRVTDETVADDTGFIDDGATD